jgi:hypothetical protein
VSTISPIPDFADACERHWEDARALHSSPTPRLANADHLYGLSAECGLKAVMVRLGMHVHPATGKPQIAKHIDKLWPAFVTFANKNSGAAYAAMLPAANPFQDWLVDQRYANQSQYAEPTPTEHMNGAGEARKVLARARLDGIVT